MKSRLIDGPYDGREVEGGFSAPAIIRCGEAGSYGHHLGEGIYRWYPQPTPLARPRCETEVDATELFGPVTNS